MRQAQASAAGLALCPYARDPQVVAEVDSGVWIIQMAQDEVMVQMTHTLESHTCPCHVPCWCFLEAEQWSRDPWRVPSPFPECARGHESRPACRAWSLPSELSLERSAPQQLGGWCGRCWPGALRLLHPCDLQTLIAQGIRLGAVSWTPEEEGPLLTCFP